MEIQAKACQYMLIIHLLIICKLYIYLLKSKLKTMVSSLIFEHNFHVIRCFVDTRNQMLKKIHHTLLPVVNIVLNFTFPRNNP